MLSILSEGQNSQPPSHIDWESNKKYLEVPKDSSAILYTINVSNRKDSVAANSGPPLGVKLNSISSRLRNMEGDQEVNTYRLIMYDFNSPELNANQQLIASNFIKSDVSDKSEIKVFGFTDTKGDASHNQTLSEGRARSAAIALGTKASDDVRGFGEDYPLYDNTLPEGRMYNRTVVIQVRTTFK
jgi:outer membrane protein OmpA-like peptidoglycan-associated protein